MPWLLMRWAWMDLLGCAEWLEPFEFTGSILKVLRTRIYFHWWGHAVCKIEPVDFSTSEFKKRIDNSWDSSWAADAAKHKLKTLPMPANPEELVKAILGGPPRIVSPRVVEQQHRGEDGSGWM
jgi:hypothetical protein